MTTSRAAVAAYLALGAVWGMNFVYMHLAAPLISAAQTTLLRVTFGLIPILVFAAVTRALAWWHLRHLHHFAVQAVLATGFYYYAYAAGTYRLDSSVAGALSGSIPLFAALGAIVVFRTEPFTKRKLLGVIVGAIGVAVLARPWAANAVDITGVVWMLAGSASLGISFGYTRRFISPLKIPAAAAVTYQMLIATLGLAMITDWTGITAITTDTVVLTGVIVGLGVLGTGFAFVFYYVTVAKLGAVTASTATYIPPVVAMIIGVGMLDEPFHLTTIGGVVLILGSAVMSQMPSRSSTSKISTHRSAGPLAQTIDHTTASIGNET